MGDAAYASLDREKFDVIVLGTGVGESVIAAACARAGKTVLHIDHRNRYGSQYTQYTLQEAVEWLSEAREGKCDEPKDQLLPINSIIPVEYSNISPSEWQDIADRQKQRRFGATISPVIQQVEATNISDEERPLAGDADASQCNQPIAEPTEESQDEKEESKEEATPSCPSSESTPLAKPQEVQEDNTAMDFLVSNGRRINIDLISKPLLSRGDLVHILIHSGVGKYLEFRAVDSVRVPGVKENTWEVVPTHKSEVFQAKSLSLLEKRAMMKFLQFCQGIMKSRERTDAYAFGKYEPVTISSEVSADETLFESNKDAPLTSFLKKQFRLSDKCAAYIMYSICGCVGTNEAETLSTSDGFERVQRYAESVGVYGKSAYLFPHYGCAEIPQGFCRLSAVFGGMYVLGRPIRGLHMEEGRAAGIVDVTGDVIRAEHIVCGTEYASAFPESVVEDIGNVYVQRCTALCTKPLVEGDGCVLVTIPPTGDRTSTVFAVQEDADSHNCPTGTFLVHLWCTVTSPSSPTEATVLKKFLSSHYDVLSTGSEDYESLCSADRGAVLWYIVTEQKVASAQLPPEWQVHVTSTANGSLLTDHAVREARAMFRSLYPEEEFLPAPPSPEEDEMQERIMEEAREADELEKPEGDVEEAKEKENSDVENGDDANGDNEGEDDGCGES